MNINFKAFSDQVVNELKNTGSDFWNNFNNDQRVFLEERARRLVDLYAEYITELNNPPRLLVIDQNIKAVLNTLTSEAALLQFKAEVTIRQTIANILKKSAAFAFSALGAL